MQVRQLFSWESRTLMSTHYENGLILFNTKQYKLAEEEFRQEIVDNPDNSRAHAMLAMSMSQLAQFNEAEKQAKLAIANAPDYAYAHYALACALNCLRKKSDAEACVNEAIRLDPNDPSFYALASRIAMEKGQFQAGLDLAERGLQHKPDDFDCTTNRAVALIHLGKIDEADAVLEAALSMNPQSCVAQINKGYVAFRKKNYTLAMDYYREALRLEPNSQMARQGVVTLLKARQPIYGAFLSFSLWFSTLSRPVRIIILVLTGLLWFTPARYIFCLAVTIAVLGGYLFVIGLYLDPTGRKFLSQQEITNCKRAIVLFGSSVAILVLGLFVWGGLTGYLYAMLDHSADDTIAQARASFENKHFAEARSVYKSLVKKADDYYSKGNLYAASDIYKKVQADWKDKLGTADHDFPMILLHNSRCEASMNEGATAERLAQQSLALLNSSQKRADHDLAFAYDTLAMAEETCQRHSDAENHWAMAMDYLKNDPRYSHDLLQVSKKYVAVLEKNGKHSQAEIISGSAKSIVDYQSYIANVEAKVKTNWHPAKRLEGGLAIASFLISPDGVIHSAKLTKSSGDADSDKAALDAIERASPVLAPPPMTMKDKQIAVQLTFNLD
jgi:TonB family protein